MDQDDEEVGKENGEDDEDEEEDNEDEEEIGNCLLYTSPSPRDLSTSRMPSSA